MKAFEVYHSKAGLGKLTVVLAESEESVETALANKVEEYQIDDGWCSIQSIIEIPLSRVMVKDLSVAELLNLIKGN